MFLPHKIAPPLLPHQVHIWKVNLDISQKKVDTYFKTLSVDEQDRANRFRFEHLRRRYVAGRGVLRVILGNYLDIRPKDLVFGYNAQGKPFLANQVSSFFNMSNGEDWALIAIGDYAEMGVDIELVDPKVEFEIIAPRFFSAREASAVMGLPSEERADVFFNCWTRKEAFIKAKGGGLSIPLDQFEVTLLPDEVPALLEIKWSEGEASEWTMRSFDVGKRFRGALAVRGRLEEVLFLDYLV